MPSIKNRPLAALAALALGLRVACAVVTEFKPIFPDYYYTDATMIHAQALGALETVRAGRAPVINGSLSERVQTLLSLWIYRGFGPRPFLIKLFNALLGALAVAAFVWALSMVFAARTAQVAGLGMAVWPSHVFYTSQNLKEAPVALLAYAALGCALAAGFQPWGSRSKTSALALAAGSALLGAGIYRSYVLLCLAGALLAALALAAFRAPRTNALVTAAALLAALALYPSASSALLDSFRAERLGPGDAARIQPHLIPVTYDGYSPNVYRPTSPEGISGFRKTRQEADRVWTENRTHREIGTQIYPGAAFKTWLDVLLYLPKGAFTVLFMPLPGLYPMDGKIGRWAAAGENTVLLAMALLAAAGFTRRKKTPERLGLIAFFAAMAVGSALLEFDLGSAGRHKLLYLPMLFPFAAEEAKRLFTGQEPA